MLFYRLICLFAGLKKIGMSRVSGLMDGGEMKRYHATLARMCFVTFYSRRS